MQQKKIPLNYACDAKNVPSDFVPTETSCYFCNVSLNTAVGISKVGRLLTMDAMVTGVQIYYKSCPNCFVFVLFAIFILHSRESELYRYTLDGKSALAWELPFSRFYGSPVFHMKVGRPVKCLAQGHNKRACRLVLHNLP